ncbi:MAG: L,D-transpeptidase family protein [bacterium]
MNGLERVDKPRQWPLVVGLGLVVLVGVGVFGWMRWQKDDVLVVDPVGRPARPFDVAQGRPLALQNTGDQMVLGDGVPPATGLLQQAVSVVTNPSASPNPSDIVSPKPDASALATEADALLAAGKKDLARETLFKALVASPEAPLRAVLEEKLGKLNAEMIRLPWPMAEKQDYVVQENDAIKFIARKFGTTVEMIVKGNELKRPDIIRPGQRLKVFTGKMEMVVSKSRHDLLLTANGRFFKRYRVATGRYEKTPVGSFSVVERIPEPPWHREDGKVIPFGDKENILGTRWLAIKATGATPEIKGYGIHGTWDDASIGKSESAGCIRLKNEDVEELFEMVPVGTSVVIEE